MYYNEVCFKKYEKRARIMENYMFIFYLAMILLSTKILGLISKKFKMPQVVGALIAGLVFGPACLGIIEDISFIDFTAEIGVIVLMFCAGMETDIKELKESGKASLIIALIGVIVPLIGGYGVGMIFNRPGVIDSDASSSLFLQNIFIGIILTATSVSITVETLKEIGKLKSKAGNAILGAAIIDDILGIVALTIITSMADSSVNIAVVLLKIAGFFVFSIITGIIIYKAYQKWSHSTEIGLHRYAIIAFVYCLILSFIAEQYFGVADITGAFVAGLVLSSTEKSKYIAAKFDVISYLYLAPVFFASVGLKVVIPSMSKSVILFAVVLVIIAIFTKIIGCGLGAKLCKYTNKQSIQVGVGMISRGEVALIVANKGSSLGLLGSNFLGPVVIVVVITTIITPILLKLVFRKDDDENIEGDGFSGGFEEMHRLRHHGIIAK